MEDEISNLIEYQYGMKETVRKQFNMVAGAMEKRKDFDCKKRQKHIQSMVQAVSYPIKGL